MPGGVIHHIDLAGVEAGLKLGKGDLQLDDGGMAARIIQFLGFHQGRFERLNPALEEGYVGEDPDAAGLGTGVAGSLMAGIVDLVIEVKVLAAGEDMSDAGDNLGAISNQRVINLPCLAPRWSWLESTTELIFSGALLRSGMVSRFQTNPCVRSDSRERQTSDDTGLPAVQIR